MKLIVATCQYAVSGNIRRNMNTIMRQMRKASGMGATVVHFSETSLSGYPGLGFPTYDDMDWDLLRTCTECIMALAKELNVWVILGSIHPLTGRHKPHNSLYVINDNGKLIDRYDKMFCAGDNSGLHSELNHFSPGSKFVDFEIKGIKCAVLLCHDLRYPELYRVLKKKGVQLVFQSFYHAGRPEKLFRSQKNIHGIVVPPIMQSHAANNFMWMSVCNGSGRECCWPSFFVNPDGEIYGRLKRNKAGILISEVDTEGKFHDASGYWRYRAMKGIYHSGTVVNDKRSDDRQSL